MGTSYPRSVSACFKPVWINADNYCSDFVRAIKEWGGRKNKTVATFGAGPDSFLNITALLRNLMIASSSLLLSRLDRTCQSMGSDTLVHTLNQFRLQNITAHQLIPLVRRRGDPDCQTGAQKLNFLTYGSPKLRYILEVVNQYSLPLDPSCRPRKLLVTEKLPLCALFFELVLNLIYVQAAVLHAGLSDTERVALVHKFNDPNDKLTVLIIMYQVSG